MENNKLALTALDDFPAHTVGHDILRYVAFPELVGGERDPLLYFIGKSIARRFDIQSMDDVIYFFNKMKWGNLEIIKEKKNEYQFHLMADEVAMRIRSSMEVDFRMEAGFLANAIETMVEKQCECYDTVNEKLLRIEFRAIIVE